MSTSRSRARRTMPVIVNLDGDNIHLANLCGPLDENLRQLADGMGVKLARRGSRVTIEGEQAELAGRALRRFHEQATHRALSVDDIQLGLVEIGVGRPAEVQADPRELDQTLPPVDDESGGVVLRTRRTDLRPRTPRQRDYMNNILKHDITFGVGPAGTGKTWLAVACAIDAMERDTVQRLVLTRPAVEAGERLGFLPGDLAQKVDPYQRQGRPDVVAQELELPALGIGEQLLRSLVWNVHDVDAGFLLQRLEHQVRRGADARMAECGLALLSAAGFEQLRQCPGVRRVRCHHHR
ncbi:PhoH domain protein, partial [Bordetella bronchiseptica D993]